MPKHYSECLTKAEKKGVRNKYAYCSPVLKRENAAHPGRHWVEATPKTRGHWARNPRPEGLKPLRPRGGRVR